MLDEMKNKMKNKLKNLANYKQYITNRNNNNFDPFFFLLLLILCITVLGSIYNYKLFIIYLIMFIIYIWLYIMYNKGYIYRCKLFDNIFSELSICLRLITPLIYLIPLSYILLIFIRVLISIILRWTFKSKISLFQTIFTVFFSFLHHIPFGLHNIKSHLSPELASIVTPEATERVPAVITQREVDGANYAIMDVNRMLPSERAILAQGVLDKMRLSGGNYTGFTYQEHAVIKFFMKDFAAHMHMRFSYSGYNQDHRTHPVYYQGWARPGNFELTGNNTLRATGSVAHNSRFTKWFKVELSRYKNQNNL